MQSRIPPLYLSAWKALLRAHASAVSQIETRLAATRNIPLLEYDVLVELLHAPNHRLRMAELAERVLLSRSGLTRLVDRLEQQGYLRREAALADRRGTDAVLTEAGRGALKAAWPVYAAGIQDAFARHLAQDDAKVLTACLSRMSSVRGNEDLLP